MTTFVREGWVILSIDKEIGINLWLMNSYRMICSLELWPLLLLVSWILTMHFDGSIMLMAPFPQKPRTMQLEDQFQIKDIKFFLWFGNGIGLKELCGGEPKTLFRTFRDCHRIMLLWNCTLTPNPREFFNANVWTNWLGSNLQQQHTTDSQNWPLYFGSILDNIWRFKNEFVFANTNNVSFRSMLIKAKEPVQAYLHSSFVFRPFLTIFFYYLALSKK